MEKFEFVNKAPLKNKFNQRKEILFLQVANFVEVKGHKYTIEAFSRFNKIYPASRLILAGDGPLRGAMIQLSKELDIENLVEFPGVVDEDTVLNMMEKADVFLYHSLQLSNGVKEGLPTALMEAMARGLTVISSKHSAIPELIIDGVNGFLVSERDVTSYFNTMLKLKESNQEIRFNARETILKNFSLSITRDKLTKIYFQMINER